jgi:hypothetical protein
MKILILGSQGNLGQDLVGVFLAADAGLATIQPAFCNDSRSAFAINSARGFSPRQRGPRGGNGHCRGVYHHAIK